MTGRDPARGLVAGIIAGAAGGMFGVGGGLVLVPLLTSFFSLSQHRAHGTSLGVIGLSALGSLTVYAWRGQVDWTSALLIAPGTLLTARLGARWASRTSPAGLRRAFAVFLLIVAGRLLWGTPALPALQAPPLWLNVSLDLLLGAAAGLLAGYMGVGGGIIVVPALVLMRAFDQHLAQGTSLAVILAAAPMAAYEHYRHGNLETRMIPALAVGALLGGPLGGTLAHATPSPLLVRVFAVFLILNAAITWQRARPAPAGN